MITSLHQKSTVTCVKDCTSITPFEEMGNPLEGNRSWFVEARDIKDESVSFEEMKDKDWSTRSTASLLVRG